MGDIDDKVFEKVMREMRRAQPFLKCSFCHADIILNRPESTVACTYVAKDEFERRVQAKQRNAKIPCTDLWKANEPKFRNERVTVICYQRCQRQQVRRLWEVEWT
jgi:hypothetical protein